MILWKRKWQPTPVFLPGKSHGQRSLVGYSPWGHKRVGHNWATEDAWMHGGWVRENKVESGCLELGQGLGLVVGRGHLPPWDVPWKGAHLGLAWRGSWPQALSALVLMDSPGRWEPAGHPRQPCPPVALLLGWPAAWPTDQLPAVLLHPGTVWLGLLCPAAFLSDFSQQAAGSEHTGTQISG